MFDFSNQVVMVTGATGSLGKAIAQRFAQAGAKLVLLSRSIEHLQAEFPSLVQSPGVWLAAIEQAGDLEAMQRAVAEGVEHFGRLDVLVNTVGGFRAGTPLHKTPLETWEYMLDLNARSVFVASQAVIPILLGQNSGKIINIASRAALSGNANAAAYSAAKSAVVRLTESMAAELKAAGINVNCVLPGTIDTPQNRQDMPDADYSRWVAPEAIADVILFLASEAARAVHGATIPVYGLT